MPAEADVTRSKLPEAEVAGGAEYPAGGLDFKSLHSPNQRINLILQIPLAHSRILYRVGGRRLSWARIRAFKKACHK